MPDRPVATTTDPQPPADLAGRIRIFRASDLKGEVTVALDGGVSLRGHCVLLPGRRPCFIVPMAIDADDKLLPAYTLPVGLQAAIEREIHRRWPSLKIGEAL